MGATTRNTVTTDVAIWDDENKTRSPSEAKNTQCFGSLSDNADCDDNSRRIRKLAELRVSWARSEMNRPDEDIFYIHGKRLPVWRLRCAVHDMLNDAENLLWRDLMWSKRQEERFEIDLSAMQDNLSVKGKGVSWVTNKTNELRGMEEWMFDRMVRSPENERLCERSSWRMGRIQEYAKIRRRFLELLLTLVLIAGGPPAGGDEITGITHRNGIGEERGIYVIDGRLACATWCPQTTEVFGGTKAAIRFLPWRVGQLLAVYLVYVQPFSEELDYQTNKSPRSNYLWHDQNQRWARQHLTEVLTRETATRLGLRLTIQDYQLVAIRMGYKYIGSDFSTCLPKLELLSQEGNDGDLSIDCMHYAVLEIMESLHHDSIELSKAVSSQWHMLLDLTSIKKQS